MFYPLPISLKCYSSCPSPCAVFPCSFVHVFAGVDNPPPPLPATSPPLSTFSPLKPPSGYQHQHQHQHHHQQPKQQNQNLQDQFIKREREQVVNSLYAGSTNSSGSSYLKMNGPTNNGTNNVVASRTTWHHHMPPPPPPVAPGSNGQDYAQHHHHHHQQQQQMAMNNGSNTFGNNINLVDGYTSG